MGFGSKGMQPQAWVSPADKLGGAGEGPCLAPTHEEPAFQLLCASVGQSGTRAEHSHIVASLVEFGVLDLFLCLSKWSETGEFLRIFSLGPC